MRLKWRAKWDFDEAWDRIRLGQEKLLHVDSSATPPAVPEPEKTLV